MTHNQQNPMVASLLGLLMAVSLLSACTIVRHGENGAGKKAGPASASEETFDAAAYVDQNWADKIVPEVTKNSVDLKSVLDLLRSDPEKARSQWGHRKEDSAPYCFLVKGSYRIKAYDTESSAATVDLDVVPLQSDAPVQVQIGPVIKTSAVRDGVSFIRFGDFTNQVDFANVSRAINFRIRDTILKDFPRDGLVGKTVTFTGAFLEDASGLVLITPVTLEVRK